jgi:SNF2 family DNA or RNA helicase
MLLTDHASVVFSFWTSTLDVVQECLQKDSIGFIRFDGKVSNKQRVEVLRAFKDNDSIRVALMTISCGAVGYVSSAVHLKRPLLLTFLAWTSRRHREHI